MNVIRTTLLSAVLLAAAGCGQGEETPELARFNSCGELETWIRASAANEINYTGGGGSLGVSRGTNDVAVAMPTAAMGDDDDWDEGASAGSQDIGFPSNTSVSGDAGNRAYSTTNVQEDGVDEADFVKNDGDNIFVLDQSGLMIFDAWPADELRQLGRIEIEGQPESLYFDGVDTVVVFSTIESWGAPLSGASPLSGNSPVVETSADLGFDSWDQTTKITVVDASERANPEVRRELYFDGQLRSSRRVGDQLHVILTNDLTDFVYADDGAVFPREARRDRLSKSTFADWIPWMQDNQRIDGGWQSESRLMTTCENVYRPNVRTDLQYTGLLTIDLSDPQADLSSVGVFTRADTVYATADSLYVAMTEHDDGPFRSLDGSLDTRLHKFALDGDRTEYTASGLVPGALLNQFSMSELDDHLRVASTTDGINGNNASVFVLAQQGTALSIVGQVTDIAPDGESIYAVRFVGDRGYVVTYERIDPLFTLDLSDPTRPAVVGELEVTGFSNYLHPLGEDHLLAVGEEVDSGSWSWEGLQVSIFDVSDFGAPSLVDRRIVGEGGASSEVQWDHHAFTYFPEQEVLALPTIEWSGDSGVQATKLELLGVDLVDGLSSLGSVDHTGLLHEGAENAYSPYYASCVQVRRSIFIEDYVFAVSNYGIQVVLLETPDQTVAQATFGDGGCTGSYR